jgi:hypothetical protein
MSSSAGRVIVPTDHLEKLADAPHRHKLGGSVLHLDWDRFVGRWNASHLAHKHGPLPEEIKSATLSPSDSGRHIVIDWLTPIESNDSARRTAGTAPTLAETTSS